MVAAVDRALVALTICFLAAATSANKDADGHGGKHWPEGPVRSESLGYPAELWGTTVTETIFAIVTSRVMVTTVSTFTSQIDHTVTISSPVQEFGSLTTIIIDLTTQTVVETREPSTTTVRVKEPFIVSECPAFTGPAFARPTFASPTPCDDAKSNLTWGCLPGFTCTQPKPKGCNLWQDHPPDDFVCDPKYCIKAPSLQLTSWPQNETGYLAPNPDYFNLNPNMWGLSFDIFEQDVLTTTEGGKTRTLTTGNWGSQAGITHFPTGEAATPSNTPAAISASPIGPDTGCHSLGKKNTWPSGVPPTPHATDLCAHPTSSSPSLESHSGHRARSGSDSHIQRRDNTIFPPPCLASCENAFWIAQQVGKDYPLLCPATTPFQVYLNACLDCSLSVYDNAVSRLTQRLIITSHFNQWITFCNGRAPDPVQAAVGLTLPRSVAARAAAASGGVDDEEVSPSTRPDGDTTESSSLSTTPSAASPEIIAPPGGQLLGAPSFLLGQPQADGAVTRKSPLLLVVLTLWPPVLCAML